MGDDVAGLKKEIERLKGELEHYRKMVSGYENVLKLNEMELDNAQGLTSLLIGDADSIVDVLQPTDHEFLHVLTSGPLPPNAAELLGSPRMLEVLAELSQQADTVLLDSAPLLAVTDAAVLAGDVTGTIIVYEMGHTRLSALTAAVDVARKAGANILGVVGNRLRMPRRRYGGYGGYGEYGGYRYDDDSRRSKRRKRRQRPDHPAPGIERPADVDSLM